MAAEIERKFLLDEPPGQLEGRRGRSLEQGYLAAAAGVEVRLRREEGRHLLTIKLGQGEVREEVEIRLEAEQFEALWPLTGSRRLGKTRYLVPLSEGLKAEVDVYEGALAGLVTAEVEFGFERQGRDFEPPAWLGDEITGDSRYANRNLALEGAPAPDAGQDEGRATVPSHAYRLKTKESPSEGVRRIAMGRAEKALGRLDEVEEDELAVAIHGARKDLKKLRGLLRLLRAELGKKAFKAENRRYRDAGRLLSGSRDAEVKLETLLALRRRFDGLPDETAELWEGTLESERDAIAAALDADSEGKIAAATRAIAAGRDATQRWSLRADSWALVESGLLDSYRRGRRSLIEARSEPSAANVHEWRKRAKDLWYQLRILRDAWPELLEATIGQTHELTELLGDHHDLAVLAADLDSRSELGNRAPFEAAIERRQGELLEAALELGARLYAEKPKAFGRRIKRYWRAWRQA